MFCLTLVGAQEVGVYKYNPPTLTLKGHADGNSTPEVLEYVHWPGTSRYFFANPFEFVFHIFASL